jgi:hypothetical protein
MDFKDSGKNIVFGMPHGGVIIGVVKVTKSTIIISIISFDAKSPYNFFMVIIIRFDYIVDLCT